MLSACGGSSSETERARSVVQRYRAALAAQNGPEMCSLLTSEAKREIATLAAAITAAPTGKNRPGCVGFSNLFSSAIAHNQEALASTRDVRIGLARVTGGRATVLLREPD